MTCFYNRIRQRNSENGEREVKERGGGDRMSEQKWGDWNH